VGPRDERPPFKASRKNCGTISLTKWLPHHLVQDHARPPRAVALPCARAASPSWWGRLHLGGHGRQHLLRWGRLHLFGLGGQGRRHLLGLGGLRQRHLLGLSGRGRGHLLGLDGRGQWHLLPPPPPLPGWLA
jgi:hypothetical protein